MCRSTNAKYNRKSDAATLLFRFLEVEVCLSRRLKNYKFFGTIAEYKDTKTIPYMNRSALKR